MTDGFRGKVRRTAALAFASVLGWAALGGLTSALADGPLSGGQNIRLLFVGDPFAQIMQKELPAFEKLADGKIQLDVVGYAETHNKTLLNSQQSVSAYDVVSIDAVWMGEYASDGVLTDLTSMIPGSEVNVADFVPSVWKMGQSDGRQYGIPIQPHPEILVYRKDLFGRDGIAAPKTWDDVIKAAAHFNGKDGMAGICWNAARGAALGQTVFHLFGDAGIHPLGTDNKTPQVNDPRFKDATKYLMELMKYSPPGILNMAWDERVRTYAQGGCAMTYIWAGRAAIFEGDPKSPARGNTGYVGAPTDGDAKPVSPIGGWFLGIPSNEAKDRVKLAWNFIQWMTSADMLKFSAAHGNGTMPSYSVMRDPELIKMYPAYPIIDKLGADGDLQGWMRPPVPQFEELSELFGTVFHDMISGKITPDEAIAKAQAGAVKDMAQ